MSYEKAQMIMNALIIEKMEVKVEPADKEIMAAAFHTMVEGIAIGVVPDSMPDQYKFLMGVMDTAMTMLNALHIKGAKQ